jgi:hypothetical protein
LFNTGAGAQFLTGTGALLRWSAARPPHLERIARVRTSSTQIERKYGTTKVERKQSPVDGIDWTYQLLIGRAMTPPALNG